MAVLILKGVLTTVADSKPQAGEVMNFFAAPHGQPLGAVGSPQTDVNGIALSTPVTAITPGTVYDIQAAFAGDSAKGLNPFTTPLQQVTVNADVTITLTGVSH